MSGLAPLKRDGILVTDIVEKADILNNQFQSVFTNETFNLICIVCSNFLNILLCRTLMVEPVSNRQYNGIWQTSTVAKSPS
jgi:hypothetical protein